MQNICHRLIGPHTEFTRIRSYS